MKISMVVAVAYNNAIGGKGDLLWHLPNDMKRFKEITLGHCVLMGRRTWKSIPEKFRPLQGRENLVVSRQEGFSPEGCRVFSSVQQAMGWAKEKGESELMVIGGGEVYQQLFSRCDRIYLTRVHHRFAEADTFFPEMESEKWMLTETEKNMADAKHAYDFDFLVYDRIKP